MPDPAHTSLHLINAHVTTLFPQISIHVLIFSLDSSWLKKDRNEQRLNKRAPLRRLQEAG